MLNRIQAVPWTLAASLVAVGCTTQAPQGATQQPRQNFAILGDLVRECRKEENPCRTVVKVGARQPGNPRGCRVSWDYHAIEVPRGAQPVLVWEIEKEDPLGDKSRYAFRRQNGIDLAAEDQNDRTQDLDNEGHWTDDQTYKWKNRNLRPREGNESEPTPSKRGIRFHFRIYREGETKDCDEKDPMIINKS